jgi:hypothetical protein
MFKRLYWVGLKSQPNSGDSRRNRSGQLLEHTQAVRDNVAFDIEKAIAPNDQKLVTEGTPEVQ